LTASLPRQASSRFAKHAGEKAHKRDRDLLVLGGERRGPGEAGKKQGNGRKEEERLGPTTPFPREFFDFLFHSVFLYLFAAAALSSLSLSPAFSLPAFYSSGFLLR
jgi:hypothetical protein